MKNELKLKCRKRCNALYKIVSLKYVYKPNAENKQKKIKSINWNFRYENHMRKELIFNLYIIFYECWTKTMHKRRKKAICASHVYKYDGTGIEVNTIEINKIP